MELVLSRYRVEEPCQVFLPRRETQFLNAYAQSPKLHAVWCFYIYIYRSISSPNSFETRGIDGIATIVFDHSSLNISRIPASTLVIVPQEPHEMARFSCNSCHFKLDVMMFFVKICAGSSLYLVEVGYETYLFGNDWLRAEIMLYIGVADISIILGWSIGTVEVRESFEGVSWRKSMTRMTTSSLELYFWSHIGEKVPKEVEDEVDGPVICLSSVEFKAFATCHGGRRKIGEEWGSSYFYRWISRPHTSC